MNAGRLIQFLIVGVRLCSVLASVVVATAAVDREKQSDREDAGRTEQKPELRVTDRAKFTNGLGMRFVKVPGTDVLFSVWDTRVQDYGEFVTNTNRTWPKPSYTQGPKHPAVMVSWEDAEEFCRWLTWRERSQHRIGPHDEYRLPTDAEWSVAAGLPTEDGKTPRSKDRQIEAVFPWGDTFPPKRKVGNYADLSRQRAFPVWIPVNGYDDGFAYTSPVGSFPANQFGLYDMGGNVWQWCEDPYETGDIFRVLRGASFLIGDLSEMQTSARFKMPPFGWIEDGGFRCVLAGWSASQAKVYSHALAFCAALNGLSLDSSSDLRNKRSPAQEQSLIGESCNAHSRAEFLQALRDFEQGKRGQRIAFWALGRAVGNPPDVSDRALPLAAWDFAQYLDLCRTGYNALYLSESEAWDRILPVARLLQRSYRSWKEFAADFSHGRTASTPRITEQEVDRLSDIVSDLMSDPDGLWTEIPWNESLGKGRVAVDRFAENVQKMNSPGMSPPNPGGAKTPSTTL